MLHNKELGGRVGGLDCIEQDSQGKVGRTVCGGLSEHLQQVLLARVVTLLTARVR